MTFGAEEWVFGDDPKRYIYNTFRVARAIQCSHLYRQTGLLENDRWSLIARKLTCKEMEQRIRELERQSVIREQAENRFRESESKLESILSSMADLIFMFDKGGRFVFYHAPSPGELYFSPQDFMWKRHSQVMPGHIHRLFVKAFNKNKKGEVCEYDYPMEIQGKIKWFSARLSPVLLDGKFNGSVAVVREITIRKELEQSLQESNEKHKTLFDNTNAAIFIVDTKSGIISDANKQAENLLGLTRKRIIGMYHTDIYHPSMSGYYEEKFREHIEKGKVFDMEAELMRKDGSIVPVIISARLIDLGGKKVLQGLFKDISKEKMLLDLKREIKAKKLEEQAKGILMDRYRISEKEAWRRLQRESRRQRKKMTEIARGVISSELL